MIRVQQLKLPIEHTKEQLEQKLLQTLRISPDRLLSYKIAKRSVDARKKELHYVYAIDAVIKKEGQYLKSRKHPNIQVLQKKIYSFPQDGQERLRHRPVIIGSGPAGLFCAYQLAGYGYCPIVVERGSDVDLRSRKVAQFWETGNLDQHTNVQFGEGGAGTFSDGKLNTLVKDPMGRNAEVLRIFVEMGAPEEILYLNKPHIGTDLLKAVVKNLRKKIQAMGGSYLFEHQLTDIREKEGHIAELTLCENGDFRKLPTDVLVLAIGHSARDTYEMLYDRGLLMQEKAFAVGLRVEHPQEMIDECQYHGKKHALLPAAAYKLTANLESGRGVYSFCMCPGGYVVNASSEQGYLAVNGMSYHARDGANANSAIIVSVNPADYGGTGPFSGIGFQRTLEQRAYLLGQGKIPQQLYGDFQANRVSDTYGGFPSAVKGTSTFANLREILPEELNEAFIRGMEQFSQVIPNYDRYDAILSGVESRTSAPVRIPRNERFEGSIAGIYPCGEGAGYAGGIMSAAMDGLKVAEAIAGKYKRIESTEGRKEIE